MATDALLGILIGNLNTFVKNEIAALSGVDSLIQELSDNLEAIRALFQDATEEQFKSHAIKDWLKKLSDAMHVLEDILEDCSRESNRLQSEGWLARFQPKTILFRHAISKRMKDMVKRFQRIDDDRRRFQLPLGVRQRQQEDDDLRLTGSAIPEHQMYGRFSFEAIITRSFFQEVSIDKYGNTTFKIHDLFLDLARSIVGEEYKAYGESASLTNLSRRVHHVSYSGLPELNQNTLKNIESLRTFIDLDPAISNPLIRYSALVLRKVQLCNSLRALRTRSSELSVLKSLTHLSCHEGCQLSFPVAPGGQNVPEGQV
ncbi:putative disease resistance protein RGA4 [Arachis stenosperma]|uniref:putative disease resistance protein RGA4 n=1 Tax=Arachis stenosperma TaxID=217475 RepID=UPI0025AC0091|nr:putative disease resistance protein RGA4 [Arachis stenosperma]